MDGSLSPKWNDSRLISIPKMTEEILEAFESDSITFTVYGKQVEGKGTAPKVSYCQDYIKCPRNVINMSWWMSKCHNISIYRIFRCQHGKWKKNKELRIRTNQLLQVHSGDSRLAHESFNAWTSHKHDSYRALMTNKC